MSEVNSHTPTAYMVRYTPPPEDWQVGKLAPEEEVNFTSDPFCYAAWNFEADITELYSGPIAAAAPQMLAALSLVRMSNSWRYLADETKVIIDAAIAAAGDA